MLEETNEFWQSKKIEELAQEQDVKPITDINEILDTWPGEIDDGFEESIDKLRKSNG